MTNLTNGYFWMVEEKGELAILGGSNRLRNEANRKVLIFLEWFDLP